MLKYFWGKYAINKKTFVIRQLGIFSIFSLLTLPITDVQLFHSMANLKYLLYAAMLALLWVQILNMVRRVVDLGKPMILMILAFIPYINLFFIAYLCLAKDPATKI